MDKLDLLNTQIIHSNPSKEFLASNPKAIPVYMEQRAYKELLGFKVSGKYDFVAEGKVQDFKSTSTFKHMQVVKELPALQKIMRMTEDECRLYYLSKTTFYIISI